MVPVEESTIASCCTGQDNVGVKIPEFSGILPWLAPLGLQLGPLPKTSGQMACFAQRVPAVGVAASPCYCCVGPST